MASLRDLNAGVTSLPTDLLEAANSAASKGDVVDVADLSLRLLTELESTEEPGPIQGLLLETLRKGGAPAVAIFLQVFAAADGLSNSRAVECLRRLRIDPVSLLEYLNSEQVVKLGLVDNALARKRYQRMIGLETRTLTFDLARDCPYGYAQLTVLLSQEQSLNDELWHRVLDLVGVYSLEPFRVLCVAIDLLVFDKQGIDDESLQWLAHSQWRNHPDLPAALEMYLDEPLGIQLAARLTVLGAVTFTAMFAYLDPKNQGFRDYERQIREEHETASQSGANALAMSELLDDDDDDEMDEDGLHSEDATPNEAGADVRLSEEPSEEPSEAGHVERIQSALSYIGDVFAFTTLEQENGAAQAALQYVNAFPLIAGYSDNIAHGLSTMTCNLLKSSTPSQQNILQRANQYLIHVSHNLGDDIWRLLNALAVTGYEESPEFWTNFFRQFMLPSLDFKETASSVLWMFEEQRRFALYNDLQSRIAKENFFVKSRFAKAEKETKNILKRLTKSDAEEKVVPALLEIFAQSPLPSLAAFVNQVESYNIGSLVARSTSTKIPALAMDMLPLIIMQQMTTSGRVAQTEDGLYESRWFRLLASFAGEVASQHTDFDFISLIVLVLRQFGVEDYSQVIILEQLILRLSGIPLTSNTSIPQILALGSATTVREIAQAALTEQSHPSRGRLVESLQQRDLLIEVFVALCHVYNHMLLTGTNAKVVVNRRDLVAELILVYTELIGGSAHLDVRELCADFDVPVPFAMALWRANTRELSVPDIAHNLPGFELWAGKVSPDLYFRFWHMSTFDIVFDERLYTAVGEIEDAKVIEKSSLSHKLRTKSVRQKLTSVKDTWFSGPTGQWDAEALVGSLIVPRLVVSPVDAVYVSRFLELLQDIDPSGFEPAAIYDILFSRGTVLALLHTASPLELESFATFLTDRFQQLLRHSDAIQSLKGWSNVVTAALLDVAVPTQSYIVLSNVFAFLQKTGYVFPIMSSDGEALLRRVHILTVSLTDGDLETRAKSLYAQLNKRKGSWIASEELGALHDSAFFKAMVENNERLESRLIASISGMFASDGRSQKNRSTGSGRNFSLRDSDDRKNGKASRKQGEADSDLHARHGRDEDIPESLPSKPRFDDSRGYKGPGYSRDKGRKRRY